MANFTRRKFLQVTGGAVAVSSLGFPAIVGAATKKVVIVGGGVGGATAAKYIRMADSSIDVTLIEPNTEYYTCFMSNEVLSGHRTMESIKVTYDGLKGHGVTVVHDTVTAIDPDGKKVTTNGGQTFDYDLSMPLDEIRKTYTFDVSCQGSVPQSIVAFLEAEDFVDAVRNAISLGGDADTMACIAGGIAEAFWGVPGEIEERVVGVLDDGLRRVVGEFVGRWPGSDAA